MFYKLGPLFDSHGPPRDQERGLIPIIRVMYRFPSTRTEPGPINTLGLRPVTTNQD